MGLLLCCFIKKNSKDKIRPTESSYFHQEVIKIYEDFKIHFLEVSKNNFPISLIELKKQFAVQIENSKKKLFETFPNASAASKSNLKFINYFELKCRALEAYFCYLNDIKSLQLLRNIKIKFLHEYISQNVDRLSLISCYFNAIQGTYELQGLSELNSLFENTDFDQVLEIIDVQYRSAVSELNKKYDEILTSNPIDEDVYILTLGIDPYDI